MSEHSKRNSFSKSALLLSPCTAWASPEAKWFDDSNVPKEKRDKGIQVHRLIHMENLETGKYGEPIPGDYYTSLGDLGPAYVLANKAIKYKSEVLSPRCETIQTEVCVGVNWSTGDAEIFPEVHDRNYPDRSGWQYGTADLVCRLKNGGLLIGDWKTGGTEGAKEQLLSLLYGFSIAMKQTQPLIISCLLVNEDGVWPEEQNVSIGELSAHRDSMMFQWEAVGKTGPVPGIHCTTLYCPHLAFCEAVTGLVVEAAEGPKGLLPAHQLAKKYRFQMTDTPGSDEEAGYVMERVSAAKRQVGYYTEAMKNYVKAGNSVRSGQFVWEDRGNGFRWYRG